MKYATDRVHPDEPCYGLFEGVRRVKGKRRWIQAVYVVRGDAIAEWTKDYGPASRYEEKVQPLLVASWGDDRVGEIQEMADRNRSDHYWYNRSREMKEGSTLISRFIEQLELGKALIRNQSVLGPSYSRQSNDFPREAMKARIEERNGTGIRTRAD